MAMNPEIRAVVDDFVGNIGHEGTVETIAPELFMDGEDFKIQTISIKDIFCFDIWLSFVNFGSSKRAGVVT